MSLTFRRSLVKAAILVTVTAGCGAGDRAAPPARVAGMEISHHRLARFSPVEGTRFLYAPLVGDASWKSYSSDGSRAKDLLFFDVTSKQAHWLLADPGRRLRFYDLVVDPPHPQSWRSRDEDEERRTLGVLFESVPDPAPEENAADASIGLASADGRDPKILVEAASGLLGHHLVGEDSLIVFYNRDGELWAIDVDPVERSVRSDARVSAARTPLGR